MKATLTLAGPPTRLSGRFRPAPVAWLAAVLLCVNLVGCGGGSDTAAVSQQSAAASVQPGSAGGIAAPVANGSADQSVKAAVALAAPDPGLLLLLVPDGIDDQDPGIMAWEDAAREVGVRMAPITDSQFLSLGTSGALAYAGLVLPDQIHTVATDQLVAAVHDYTNAGGSTFLTFDFAALTRRADGPLVYPIPKSRLSDLAGVDYVLYDKYLDRTVGLGPVTAMRTTMRELLVPPGKSEPFSTAGPVALPTAPGGTITVGPTTITVGPPSVGNKDRLQVGPAGAIDVASQVPLLRAAGVGPGQALYLPVSPGDPGGVHGFDPQQYQIQPMASSSQLRSPNRLKELKAQVGFGQAVRAAAPNEASRFVAAASTKAIGVFGGGSGGAADGGAVVRTGLGDNGPDVLQAYHGYALGFLIYPSYVTEGSYAGTVLATSPQFGLVAGVKSYGAGRVLFVNLPLTYLKGRTDALPMHGFLQYFVKHLLGGAQLSSMPNGVPGMMFNWHLDSMEAQQPTLQLETAGIFNAGPMSIHITAGPDTVVPGDGLGFDLNNNPTMQAFLRRMDAKGHSIGSHGGWDHDYYGLNANETNSATFLPFLVLNRQAVDNAVGHPTRDYSAPEGNNPHWAMDWLAQQGVVSAYFGGHTGLGVTRDYRDGILNTPTLWVVPVTPMGLYATFEEFQDFNVPKADVINWYLDLVDFDLTHDTARMVYAHPPGASEWIDVVQTLEAYVRSKGASKFSWYTMPRLADFMAKRNEVQWSEQSLANGVTQFTASHPISLKELVWRLPKARYLRPTAVSGGSVADGGTVWLVKAGANARTLTFRASSSTTWAPF
ncbi:MAG: hypothetical protein J0I00_11035 [Burkholderiales bacterium]|uniref:polysaccharide deacetylase family protein n=1 Tax=Ottowia sp. TaxID=1898956 RepID=UPI001AD2C921|nr:polysaccharide deacetylase family protein [Ottowia sp.]MBN9405942.1 hypothetical protein [Burkholderiales bacterium]MBS0401753.1 hypothetical protein [Pseudomonadota bacterium]MBS0414187.1 hypothetical protein [Pseudomonadota bacterium]